MTVRLKMIFRWQFTKNQAENTVQNTYVLPVLYTGFGHKELTQRIGFYSTISTEITLKLLSYRNKWINWCWVQYINPPKSPRWSLSSSSSPLTELPHSEITEQLRLNNFTQCNHPKNLTSSQNCLINPV